MRLFDAVKSSVTTIQAAEYYGINIRREMWCLCPFHKEKTPSAKVDDRFHCFGCGADYSVVDFTANVFGLTPVDAAKKLAKDFGVPYDDQRKYYPTREELFKQKKLKKQRENSEKLGKLLKRYLGVLRDYYQLLMIWRKIYAPKTAVEELHPLFCEALRNMDFTEYVIDVLTVGTTEEKMYLIAEYGRGIILLEKRLFKLAERITNRTGEAV